MTERSKLEEDWEEVRRGKGWTRPRWKQILLWIRYRPYYKFMGWQVNIRYKTADFLFLKYHRDFPFFRVMKWVAKGERDTNNDRTSEYLNSLIVEVHRGPSCSCTNSTVKDFGFPHNLIWLPAPEYTWVGDRWAIIEDKLFGHKRKRLGGE